MNMKYKNFLKVEKPITKFDENFNEDDADELLKQRAKKFSRQLSEQLKGVTLKAFGKGGHGLWGSSDEVKEYKIASMTSQWSYVFDSPWLKSKEPHVITYVNVALEKYRTASNGLIYTDETFLRNIKKEIKKLDFGGEIDYTEQGMQGETYVSMSIIYPMEVIAPDLANHLKTQKKEVEKNKVKPKKKSKLKI
jgi:hypothetical protein